MSAFSIEYDNLHFLILNYWENDSNYELLNTLIVSIVDGTIKINKAILISVYTCLQDAHDKIIFLQLKSQVQQDELQQNGQHFELVLI